MSKIENPQKEEVKNMMIAMILVTLIFFGFNLNIGIYWPT